MVKRKNKPCYVNRFLDLDQLNAFVRRNLDELPPTNSAGAALVLVHHSDRRAPGGLYLK
jgi:hypothetical protein